MHIVLTIIDFPNVDYFEYNPHEHKTYWSLSDGPIERLVESVLAMTLHKNYDKITVQGVDEATRKSAMKLAEEIGATYDNGESTIP